MMEDVKQIYEQQIVNYTKQTQELKKKKSAVAWARLLVILLIGFWIYSQYNSGWKILGLGILVGIILFLFLVARDVNLKDRLMFVQTLLGINEEESKGLNNDYAHWESGSRYLKPEHAYESDLDIFGPHSLFQYINRCESEGGQDLLANYFSKASDKKTILERQKAIQVMASQSDWRQHFQAFGKIALLKRDIEENVATWRAQSMEYRASFWKVLIWIYPVISLGVTYAYLDDLISGGIFSLFLTFSLLFSFGLSKKIQKTFDILSKFYPKISVMGNQIANMEILDTKNSELLKQIQQKIASEKGESASASLYSLGKILKLFEARLNVFLFVILNTFLLWDLRVNLKLNDWKKKYGEKLPIWLEEIYHLEALNSLAASVYNHPSWCFPEIVDSYFELNGENIGHPLIAESKRINNDFSIAGQGKIALITGSNMGGKSTFLRSVGVNMVLAYAGGAVCADKFRLSIVRLMSSMRIADNLAENTSTFYAELKKIRAIIEAVNKGEKVFILLDEILRGTNSLDRHAGSKALMQQLIRENAVAVIATHDVELANLVEDYPKVIANYHFDVEVDNANQLYFDYKLKLGVCQRMNAAILMQQIGIEM